VIDFGIARALDAADGPTRTGQFVGTPNYLPPELLRGEQVTAASDVFSWGCVVAYAGTGQAPFAGRTVPEIFYRVAHDPPKLDGLDPGLRDLVAAALDKDPRNRPSVQELLARLVGHSRPDPERIAETVQAGWHGAVPPTTPQSFSPAPPTQPVGYQVTAYPGAGGTRSDTPPGQPAPPYGQRPAGRGVPKKALIIGAAALVVVIAGAATLYAVLGGNGPPGKLASEFSDDFSNYNSGWSGGSTFTGGYGYLNGKYRLETDSVTPERTQWVPKDQASQMPERMLVSVTAASSKGGPDSRYGLLCRGNEDAKTQYAFLIRNDGKGALLRKSAGDQGNKELVNVDEVPGFKPGRANRLQIACEPQNGNKQVKLRLWANGSLVLEATDADRPLPHGWAGMAIERGGNEAQQSVVDFDDFDLSKILG
jgi:hypothetical protein